MRPLFLAITFLVTLSAQDNFIGDVFEKGSINYGDPVSYTHLRAHETLR